jgi:hypothetical protein
MNLPHQYVPREESYYIPQLERAEKQERQPCERFISGKPLDNGCQKHSNYYLSAPNSEHMPLGLLQSLHGGGLLHQSPLLWLSPVYERKAVRVVGLIPASRK